jgi:O-acetyl-ADP-ribose deacetylase (regulator of RNase III)
MNTLLIERTLPAGQTLQIVQGDITIEKVDALVNAANDHLLHGGGVAAAIVKKGGHIIQQESYDWIETKGVVSHSHPAWTSAGLLPAKYVIHAVGPVWGDGEEDAKLAAAVTGTLRVADELNLTSIAMPAISTGIFGFPRDRAAGIIFKSINTYFGAKGDSPVKLVRIVLFDDATVNVFLDIWKKTWGE